jgi:hypothetical protein
MGHPATETMRRVLKERVAPELRSRGFKGSFPRFKRQRGETTDRLDFQFSQWGGGFYMNVNGLLRLGARAPKRDHLFEVPWEVPPEELERACQERADEVLALIAEQGERWWRAGATEYPEYGAASRPAT